MQTDINDILIFTQVIEAGSFTAAASKLGLPKSTVSRKVARLEEHLDTRLVQRSTRKLVVTDAGKRLYEHGKALSQQWEEAEQAVLNLSGKPVGLLKVTAPVEMGPVLIPMVATFLDQNDAVQLELDLSNRYVDLVAEGFHVALRAGERLKDSGLSARKLTNSSAILVASAEYLTCFGTPTVLEELSNHRCILFPTFSTIASWSLSDEHGTREIPVKGCFAANNLDTVKNAALNGLGVARIPEQFCHNELIAGTLVEVLPRSVGGGGALWAVFPENRYLTPKVRAFVDFAVSYFSP